MNKEMKAAHTTSFDASVQPVTKAEDIDNIIFDVGRVLVGYEWRGLLGEKLGFDEQTMRDIEKAIFMSPMWNEVDRGVLTDEELVQAFVKNAPHREAEIRQVTTHLADTIYELDYSYPWVKSLKDAGYRCYILSNYAEKTWEQTKHKMPFLPLMDGCIWSYRVKKIKPEPGIYQELIDTYEIDPKRSVYMDDLPQNLEGAKPFGFHTILFTSWQDAIEKLKTYGVGI